MREEFQVPVLNQLDSSQPDYVSKLEEGLTQARTMYGSQLDRMDQLMIRFADELVSDIEGIEGLVVDELPEESRTEKVGDEVVKEYLMRTIVARAKTKNQSREAYDVFRQSQRFYEDGMRGLEDNLVRAERAIEDFGVAIEGLSEIVPLNEIDFNYRTLHFYIPRKDGVYELHIGFDAEGVGPSITEPRLNPNLASEDFSSKKFLEDFKRQSEGVEANAYMVTNPSELIPLGVLFMKGVTRHVGLILEHLEEGKEEENSPGGSLLDSLKEGIERLRRKTRH